MMKFFMNELKHKPSSDLTYLVKTVTKHIIGDRCSWRLWHPICQVNADGLKIMYGLTVNIEVTATDIVRVANVDQNKH